jgi:hypothetical protein
MEPLAAQPRPAFGSPSPGEGEQSCLVVTNPLAPASRSDRPNNRGKLRAPRRPGGRSRAARLGHGEQGDGRRQKERQRTWQTDQHRTVTQGREVGWSGSGLASGRRPFRSRQEGSRDPQAQRLDGLKRRPPPPQIKRRPAPVTFPATIPLTSREPARLLRQPKVPPRWMGRLMCATDTVQLQ